MFNRLATVLQELSGEEGTDGDPEEVLVSQPPASEGQAPEEYEVSEEAMERLAHLEQLVVHLKVLIQDKDTQLVQKDTELAQKDAHLKNEKEAAEARFTKLKLQAKAKVAALSKQITDLKGREGEVSPESSFSCAGVEEEVQELKNKLNEEEAKSRKLEEQLRATKQLLQVKETEHVEQLRVLQAVVCEKDVRFQEQIQKHEELLKVTQSQNGAQLQQALHAGQQRCAELEESLMSRCQMLEMLQEEVSSADQQKQILTAQFRQMEQELAEAVKRREEERRQWAEQAGRFEAELAATRTNQEALERERMEVARLQSELASLREAEHVTQQTLEREMVEIVRLEKDLALTKQAELAAVQALHDAGKRECEEIAHFERELASMREAESAVHQANKEASEREKSEVDKLEKETTSFREEQGDDQRKDLILAEMWPRLRTLALGGTCPVEENLVPADLSSFLDTVLSIETQLKRIKDEQNETEEHCAQLTDTMEALQEKLDRKTTEHEEAVTNIQQLEQQIKTMSEDSLVQRSSEEEKAHILALEEQLLAKDNELAELQQSLLLAKDQSSIMAASPEQDQEAGTTSHDSSADHPDFLEDTQEEETTLVAEDTSVVSNSVDNSSPEFIRHPSESPGESKGASSDEMVTSTDSEVAHSSWTLLEDVTSEGGHEWPSIVQDFGTMQLHSWEETSVQQESTAVQIEFSSVTIQERAELQVTQEGASPTGAILPSSQVFDHVLAEELQKRYSELTAEHQCLREAAAASEEKIKSLEKEAQSLSAAKEDAKSEITILAADLASAKEEFEKILQENDSMIEKHCIEMQLLEEQIEILTSQSNAKEEMIQVLQTDLEMVQQGLCEQEGRAQMLSAQLEERELLSSDLKSKLKDMETSMVEYSQTLELNSVSMSKKDTEISELQLCLSLKEQEMMEHNESMTTKLLQAEEEKSLIDGEVLNLKQQLLELEKFREENQKMNYESAATDLDDELLSLRKDKEELEHQLANMKKKLQAALVHRKELMKKISAFEEEEKKKISEGQDVTATGETPVKVEMSSTHNIQEMEVTFDELRQALKDKEEAVQAMKERANKQDQVLAETLALNKKLSEEAENSQQTAILHATSVLQDRVEFESECEMLQNELQKANEVHEETVRKAKEKDEHYREQLAQQKEEHIELMQRFEVQSSEQEVLVTKLRELEELQMNTKVSTEMGNLPHQDTKHLTENLEKSASSDWAQEDWVDFSASEPESSQPEPSEPIKHPIEQSEVISAQMEESLKMLKDQVESLQVANTQLEMQLQEAQDSLSLKETELMELGKEVQALREKDIQISVVSEEIGILREKYLQAESFAQTLKAEMESADRSADSITALQQEVEDFKQFLTKKDHEITELNNHITEQNSLISLIQATVQEKDQTIGSLEEQLKVEQEKTKWIKTEIPQKQEEEKDSEEKIHQLQRKLQAALISRKETLKENKSQKEQLASTEKLLVELQQKVDLAENELENLKVEKVKLINEVDQMLLENQSLGSSCESLKLAMEGIVNEKEACKREAALAKEEAARVGREWEGKVQAMKHEYETLLTSYENVSDEAARVRRVLETAKQERQELAAKVRTHEAARQEAERHTEEAQKEVETVKDKMRKFIKMKQQKILELEEENERLREMEEKSEVKRERRTLKAEFETLQEQLETAKADLNAAVAERDSLGEQVEALKEQLATVEERENKKMEVAPFSTTVVAEEIVTAQRSHTSTTKTEPVEGQLEDKEKLLTPEEVSFEDAPEDDLHPLEESPKTDQSISSTLQNKIREMEEAFNTEKELWHEREDKLKTDLASLEQELEESKEKVNVLASLEQRLQDGNEREKCLMEDGSKRKARFKEHLRNLEMEKDNLEERLMNQLAQLNGSIAGYQQEAADTRECLTKLQRTVEKLEGERAELEAQAQSDRDRACRLEEDMRQAQRERAEAEAEAGKQRELQQQLRSAQRVKEGSQSRVRQLEDLLREKQLEVRQLQNDSIQYQERISELGREAKALRLGHDKLSKKLEQSRGETSKSVEELKRTESELTRCKFELDEAQKQASKALEEKTSIEQSASRREALLKTEAEQTLDSVRFRLGGELKQMELSLEEAYRERDKEEEATLEARGMAERAERRAQDAQARLDESLARASCFPRCMSSLQDDRDRVLDEARQWETRFNDALQTKEAELRVTETQLKELSEQLQRECALKEELQLSVGRLEKADKDWQVRLEGEQNKVRESRAVLDKERTKLQETMAELERTRREARALKDEVEGLSHRAQALEEAVGQLQGEVNKAREELKEREAEERWLCLNVEQLEMDLRSSKTLTETLQTELNEKERRELEMLEEKEQAVVQAAEEARREADGRAQEAQGELEQKRDELRELEDKVRRIEEESNTSKARLDSFMKAMRSLQDDRDRVLNMYKQLEEKHLQVMMEKDDLIQEAATENNSLKEELRSLLIQRDDLHAEKAKLFAQLHGYRDELNQVLSMKDSQQKRLLTEQRRRISSLEKEREELEARLKSLRRDVDAADARVETETLSRAVDGGSHLHKVDAPGAEVEKLREQVQALEASLLQEREEQTSRNKELAELRWEGGVMRTESESAQERVAELARDLLAVEQKLLEEKEATSRLRAENQSFAKSMASLQDSRDQAVNKAQKLSLKLEEVTKAGTQTVHSGAGGSTGEVWGLKNALQALQNDRERLLEQLQNQTSELQKQKTELSRLGAGELIKVTQQFFEEKKKNEEMLGAVTQLENAVEMGKREIETLRLERVDWMAQAEQLKQQTLATLSERDQQLRQLSTLLEQARIREPKVNKEQYQREGAEEVDSAPGAPQERNSTLTSNSYIAEVKELQQRLDDEVQQRMAAEEQLMATQDRLKRHIQAKQHFAHEDDSSETAVFIEPPEGAVTRTRRGGPGLKRTLRVTFCSRQRTPLLLGIYLLTVHVLLLLCLCGFL
ncbi:LOW QUALITY PROTEIN: golgin subfamily B member 1 [Thalassophryne amazonica]|uniref:LOW QUALITY PROTEIN: golgin subfamily B member 1 n=1 Tax=Thalassophryne amazonica TaxID=390379 RepID=UPI00147191AA|nr:LOW QUALITY PROTEIN: golgin subfamily B member 1 [Thalassophryne amazonica]